MTTNAKSTKSAPANHSAPPAKSALTDDVNPINEVIASLTRQLQRENETIVSLMERQRTLRKQLLAAQERSLVALRHCSDQAEKEESSH